MSGPVWSQVVGQDRAVEMLSAAVTSAAALVSGESTDSGAMTHAWLFTGPPGSGRSVAARTFAAALQCRLGLGCGECAGCRTALAGTHADVRLVVPEGLSISVAEMRALVQAAARRPTTGRWQVVIIEDADRLTEGAANALLKAVEEPPERTVFLLCAPSDHPEDVSVTIRSRCRLVTLRTPQPDAIAAVLIERDGVAEDMARWAAAVCGGHVGRARRLATDEDARRRRAAVLRIPLGLRRAADVFDCADELIKTAEADASVESKVKDEAEQDALRTAMGSGGTGKGVAAAKRSADAAVRQLEKRQKSRATRTQRDTLDLALVDLAGFYRDVLVTASGAEATLNHPDRADDSATAAAQWTPASTLRRLDAVLACRDAIGWNVKPRIAVEAMVTTLREG
ncbi:DNA polymerase III subunit delta' [Prauserella marina]|uniref:DNA polymerase-3 subunit delta n=1 Tax=Prauserella marina TaxID=530584 RepID=A0A222VWM4_9PSEU|nr:DNA polymerase III subunit delta' [Prauserella marina]ASR38376.1 DNA polymerase III subunit delta' [Prauserella marina]PWV78401.1 DNA polymerase-3 subunit delta' [Prauserella marina]SDC85173.1 DNA polymerase-3 subunit delta' [Prauserella marina]